ncbi:hypothetical protein AWB82_06036 [Caballeronia glebae]|uniref:Uncharacterized protein n=1 Tax=Caballeronia glebae TaxID=1777143 RepID=A0A158D0A1_9BURK|nr:hypothetical protein AWB82_06036 [Caballeronia glebae]
MASARRSTRAPRLPTYAMRGASTRALLAASITRSAALSSSTQCEGTLTHSRSARRTARDSTMSRTCASAASLPETIADAGIGAAVGNRARDLAFVEPEHREHAVAARISVFHQPGAQAHEFERIECRREQIGGAAGRCVQRQRFGVEPHERGASLLRTRAAAMHHALRAALGRVKRVRAWRRSRPGCFRSARSSAVSRCADGRKDRPQKDARGVFRRHGRVDRARVRRGVLSAERARVVHRAARRAGFFSVATSHAFRCGCPSSSKPACVRRPLRSARRSGASSARS